MKTLHLPPGAAGVDHYSGASYKADRAGRVQVPDRVADDFKRNGVLRHYDVVVSGQAAGNSRPDDPTCCNRTLFDWEQACPKCGAPRPESVKEEA